MSKAEEKYNRRRLRSAYLSTIVSITLVLFMIGVLGIFIIHAGTISRYVRENIMITLVLDDQLDDGDVFSYQKKLDAAPFVKSTHYIGKEEAAADLQQELGEDFLSFLGHNPIPTTIDIYLNAAYTHPDSLAVMETLFSNEKGIASVKYQKSLAGKIHENIRKISIIILGFSILMLIISIILIHNTIRLSIYSKRFLIKTMYLIGATKQFIRWPFIKTSILQGVLGAGFSIMLIGLFLTEVYNRYPELYAVGTITTMLMLGAVLMIIGILITWLSTQYAVNKYLKTKKDNLYY